MHLRIDPADTRPIYVQIMDEVRRSIVLGNWGADEPLPSVRQLAIDLRVNPNTVQQAYRELEREGAVYVRRGQGTFAARPDAAAAERAHLASGIAERTAREAARNGVSLDELIGALRTVDLGMNGRGK